MPMRKTGVSVAVFAVLAFGLGAASAWPIDGPGALLRFAGHGLFLFVALLFFQVILPRYAGLPIRILMAMLLGIVAGWGLPALGETALVTDYLGIFGRLFILLLTVVIIPLIFVSVLCGVASIGDVRKLGALGAKTLAFYFCTTAAAVAVGITLVNLIQPGAGHGELKVEIPVSAPKASPELISTVVDLLVASDLITADAGAGLIEDSLARNREERAEMSVGAVIQSQVLPMIIQNPVMAGQNPIVIIFFALLLGAALATLGEKGEVALRVFQALDKAFIAIIMWVMLLAPLGVFALMAQAISNLGLDYIATLALYCVTVLSGLGLHFCVLTLIVCPLIGGISPMRFLRGMAPAFGVAFSSSSSSATLPVSMECVSKRVGADENITHFVLPVGATINMDGTALYVSVASLFIAQVYNIDLSFQAQLMVFLTAVLVSVGTAGIPGASIGLMSIILTSAGIPVEGVGIVFGVDRILDMSRTVVNMTGDSVGAVVISRSEGLLHDPVLED
jgi:proton glutamate symport protein